MGKQILIIEDDFETQFLFSELLAEEGYQIETASTGKEALEFIRSGGQPDLIFMDLNFPGGTPEEFTKELRSHSSVKDTPIILISGKSDIAEYAQKLQARSFIKKPFDLDPLLDLIQTVI